MSHTHIVLAVCLSAMKEEHKHAVQMPCSRTVIREEQQRKHMADMGDMGDMGDTQRGAGCRLCILCVRRCVGGARARVWMGDSMRSTSSRIDIHLRPVK